MHRLAAAGVALSIACVVLACAVESRALLALPALMFALACAVAESRYFSSTRGGVSGRPLAASPTGNTRTSR